MPAAWKQSGVDGAFTFEVRMTSSHRDPGRRSYGNARAATTWRSPFPRQSGAVGPSAYDLQLLSHGRFNPGPRSRSERRSRTVRGLVRSPHRANARDGRRPARHFATWETGETLDFHWASSGRTRSCLPSQPGPNPSVPPPSPWVGSVPNARLAAEVGDAGAGDAVQHCDALRERSLPAIAEGLARAGRDRSSISVTGEVIVCCGRNEEELEAARIAGRWLVAFYASYLRPTARCSGRGWECAPTELNGLSKSGRWDEMPRLIDDVMRVRSPPWALPRRSPPTSPPDSRAGSIASASKPLPDQ